MKTLFTLLVILFGMTSCSSIICSIYGINKNPHFTTQRQAIQYIAKSTGIPSQQILYPDSSSLNGFINNVVEQRKVILYGCFINDSMAIRTSALLSENPGCSGRADTEIQEALAGVNYSTLSAEDLTHDSIFNKTLFRHATDNIIFSKYTINKKLSVFLIYTTNFGSYYRKSFKRILEFAQANKEKINLYCILMDDITHISNTKG